METTFCSCVYCRKTYSNKGIFTHFDRSHLKLNKYFKGDASAKRSITLKERYLQNPSLCKECGIPLKQNHKNNKYCSRVCSGKSNYKIRILSGYAESPETKEKRIKTMTKEVFAFSKVYFLECIKCHNLSTLKKSPRTKLCLNCKMTDLYEYRKMSSFIFDLRLYPDKFDLISLNKYRMFNPKFNPLGMSRDHLFSVYDGFLLGIDPVIMKHPANCDLIFQKDNSAKHKKSSISYEELLTRISIFE